MKFSFHIVWQILLVLAAAFLILVVFPIWLDPYNVFHYDHIRFNGVEPNQNFIKTRYILDNPDRFDSFLFGSSRVGMLDVSKIKSGHFYNMAYSEGLPKEHLQNLRIFLDHGLKISNVWLGVDNISCFADPERHNKSLMRKAYPADGKLWKFYLPYINCSMAFNSLDTILAAKKSDGEKEKDFYATGGLQDHRRVVLRQAVEPAAEIADHGRMHQRLYAGEQGRIRKDAAGQRPAVKPPRRIQHAIAAKPDDIGQKGGIAVVQVLGCSVAIVRRHTQLIENPDDVGFSAADTARAQENPPCHRFPVILPPGCTPPARASCARNRCRGP